MAHTLEEFTSMYIYCTYCSEFYIHGSVHRNSTLIRSNKIQQYAGIYLLQKHYKSTSTYLFIFN